MKLITASGVIARARRFLSSQGSVDNPENASPDQLAKTIRLMSQRISELEARIGPEAVDFEVNLGTGGALTSILHRFSSPVRWWVVTWLQKDGVAYPVDNPSIVQDATSTNDILVLRSYNAGRAIIRVEPASAGVNPGVTVASSPDNVRLALASNFTTTSVTAVDTNLKFPVKAGEVWWFSYVGGAGDSAVGGMKYAIGAPVGSTVDAWHLGSGAVITTRVYAQFLAINTLGSVVHNVAGGERDDKIEGVVKVAIDGNISIQAATVTAATTATIYAKSSLIANRVSEV